MDFNTYCDNLASELARWKTKIGRIVTEFDRTATGDKSKVLGQVNELHMIMEEFEDRIFRLKTECSQEGQLEGAGFAGFVPRPEMPDKSVWENVSPAEFGG